MDVLSAPTVSAVTISLTMERTATVVLTLTLMAYASTTIVAMGPLVYSMAMWSAGTVYMYSAQCEAVCVGGGGGKGGGGEEVRHPWVK